MQDGREPARELVDLLVGALLLLVAVVTIGVTAFPLPFVDSAVCLLLVLGYGLLPRRVARASLMIGAYGAAYVSLFVTLALHVLRFIVDVIG